MKKFKIKINFKVKIILLVLFILLLFVVIFGIIGKKASSSPKQLVKGYMKQYQIEDKAVTSKIKYAFQDKLNSEQEKRYKEIIKKQYRRLKYTIEDSYIGDIEANFSINFTVVDLKSEYDRANSYVLSHQDKFSNGDGEIDTKKAINYKLEKMEEAEEIVEYTITITCYKDKNGDWNISYPSATDIAKLQGIF